MLTRGVFHAVTDDDLKRLRRCKEGPMRRRLIVEWDEEWPAEWRTSTDKAWKIIFAVLKHQPGPVGLRSSQIGLGVGRNMFYGRSLDRANFYVLGLIPHEWLSQIVGLLEALDEREFRELYFSAQSQQNFKDHSFQYSHGMDTTDDAWRSYAWHWLIKIRDLFRKALDAGRSLVFSADNC